MIILSLKDIKYKYAMFAKFLEDIIAKGSDMIGSIIDLAFFFVCSAFFLFRLYEWNKPFPTVDYCRISRFNEAVLPKD